MHIHVHVIIIDDMSRISCSDNRNELFSDCLVMLYWMFLNSDSWFRMTRSVWWMKQRRGSGRRPRATIILRRQHRLGRESQKCFRFGGIYKHTTSSINCLFDTSFTITSELKHMCLYVGIGPSSFLKSNSVKIIKL